MKKNFAKKVLAMTLAATCMMGAVGCGNSADAADVLMTVNDEKVSYGFANFYLRMTQGTYDTYYASLLGNDMWNQSIDGSVSLAESTVSAVVDSVKEMFILSQHADDYGITITEENMAEIEKAADSFISDNEKDTLEVMTADREVVVDYLTLYTLNQRVKSAIKAEADTEVSDEEAAQRRVAYTFFSTAGTADEDGTTTELTEEEKAVIKEKAQGLAEEVKNGAEMKTSAETLGYTTVETSYSDDNIGSMDEDIVSIADSLQDGEVGEIVEAENGYYVIQLIKSFDEEATENRKAEIVEERQNELYKTTYEKWLEESKVTEDKDVREKLLINGTVTIKADETTEKSSETPDETSEDINEDLSE